GSAAGRRRGRRVHGVGRTPRSPAAGGGSRRGAPRRARQQGGRGVSITQLWRGTGRRRLPDALEAARLRAITLNACIDDLTAARDQLLAQRDAIRVAATHLGRDLDEEMRAHAATRKAFAAAEQAHAAQTAALRDELRLSREAQQRANTEVAALKEARESLIYTHHRLEVDNRRLDREAKGAQDTQALDVTALRAGQAVAEEGNGTS